jgi:hypothetical protein
MLVLSPVRDDSSVVNNTVSISLISADIVSHVSIITISPGTNSLAAIVNLWLFLITLTFGVLSLRNNSTAFSALYSCTNQSTALRIRITDITIPSIFSPKKKLRIAAPIKIKITISVN